MGDIHKYHRIYYEYHRPEVSVPAQPRTKKNFKKLRLQSRAMRVEKWVVKQFEDSWKRIVIRDTTNGMLLVDIAHRKIWV